jgi:hypothetical protein
VQPDQPIAPIAESYTAPTENALVSQAGDDIPSV